MAEALKDRIAEKRRKLEELKRSRSQATCSSVVSSEIDVRRETEIEDLEEEIQSLERQLRGR